jgi:hypothetical protein
VILALALTLAPAGALAVLGLVARRLDRTERAVLLAACAVFAVSAVASPVSYVHDHFTHFRHARSAWENPSQLLDLWDRPAFMLLYSGPARLGLAAARLVSVVPAAVAIAATMLAARAARLPRPWLAGVLVAAQHDLFGQASSTMTELLLAAGLALACWGFLEERPWLAAAGLAFCGVTRPEAPLVVAAGTLVLVARYRRPALALAVAAPFVAYLALGTAVHADPLWIIHGNPYRETVGLRLEAGQVLHSFFYEALAEGQPPPLLLLELAGAVLVLREGRHRAIFLLGPVAALWLLCTFLRIGPHDWWRQSRYLVSIAPVLALLAARAHAALRERFPRVADPALLLTSACAAAATLAKTWRPAIMPGSPAIPALFVLAIAIAVAAWALRRRVPAPAALAGLLVAPLVLSPPGIFAHHVPTPSERAAEELVPILAARSEPAIAVDHGSLEQACARLVGDPGRPCPLPLEARSAPAPEDRVFVKQYDGTWAPPSPPEGWREVWRSTGPRIEGPLRAPVTWTTTTLLWERERQASVLPPRSPAPRGAPAARAP